MVRAVGPVSVCVFLSHVLSDAGQVFVLPLIPLCDAEGHSDVDKVSLVSLSGPAA